MAPSNRRRFAAFVGVMLVPLAIACNSIVGLSDYARADCAGGSCIDGGGTDSPINEAGGDTGGDGGGVDGGRGVAPVSWAQWTMPNYADAGPNPPDYDTTVVDEVKDKVTGLIWRQKLEGQVGTLDSADVACKKIAPPGDWRLPKRIELVTLLDYSHAAPLIDQTTFPNFQTIRVWTSSEVRPFVGGAQQAYWSVNFDTGAVEGQVGSALAAGALCVKAR